MQGVTGVTAPSGVANSAIYQDGTGNIGIGTTGPQAALDVRGITGPTGSTTVIQAGYSIGATSPPNYFIGSRAPTGLGSPTTDFIINSLGQVGVGGPANTHFDLTVNDHGYNACGDGGNGVFLAKDDGGNSLAIIANIGSSSVPAGAMVIFSNLESACSPSQPNFAFGILDQSGTLNNPIMLAAGDGTVAFGTGDPVAQVDVNLAAVGSGFSVGDRPLFHVGNYNTIHLLGGTVTTTGDYFAIDQGGFVGIGQLNTGASLVEVSDVNSIGATGMPLLEVDNGTPTSPYFMVRGSSSGVNVGIGVDPIANDDYPSTLAIKGNGGTTLDLYGNGSTIPTQIRFIDPTSGVVRHLIADNGNLLIYPGAGVSGISNTVEIDGNEQIDVNEEVLGNSQIDVNEHVEGNEQIDGAVNIGANPSPTGLGSGTFSSSILSVDGQIAAKEIVVTTTSWEDTVFSSSYQLKPLPSLESYIQQYHHLPNVPGEKDIIANGISLGDMNKLLMQKVEELTLYTINLEKRLKQLETK